MTALPHLRFAGRRQRFRAARAPSHPGAALLLILGLLLPGLLVQGLLLPGPVLARWMQQPVPPDSAAAPLFLDPELPEEDIDVELDEDGIARARLSDRAAEVEKPWRALIRAANTRLDTDPGDLDARYERAIAHTEIAKFRTLIGAFHWKPAERDYEYILARDSLYRDVLYQYARMQSFRGRHEAAIRLGERQVALKPAAVEGRIGLLDLYRRTLRRMRGSRTLDWLQQQDTPYAAFFIGEVLRQRARYAGADTIFARLLRLDSPVPRQAVLLARARLLYAQDRRTPAQESVEAAIRTIDGPLGGRLIFEDVKYILTPDEWADYRTIETAEGYVAFYERFWTRRDPMPARVLNVRMAEHYRRLLVAEEKYVYDGPRAWFNNPDKLSELDIPPVALLNHDFDDRGVVYVRHGKPDDTFIGTGGPDASIFESWRYAGRDAQDFHFTIDAGGSSQNVRLTPALPLDQIRELSVWGHPYMRAYHIEEEFDRIDLRNELAEHSREAVQQGLTTDSYAWSEEGYAIEFPYILATFRGEDGRTRLEIHYAVPMGGILDVVGARPAGRTFSWEVGFALHDTTWRRVEESLDTKTVPWVDDPTAGIFDVVRLDVPPDSYHVALHGRMLEENVLGAYKVDYDVPAYPPGAFAMSDLLLAYEAGPAEPGNPFNRGALRVRANPMQEFSVREPAYVYFEVYGLTPVTGARTHYRVAYTLASVASRRLFGRRSRTVRSLSTDYEGAGPDAFEYAELDVTDVAPGDYTLRVIVTDLQTGATIERTRPLTLVE